MNRLLTTFGLALAATFATSVAATASTLEYTFTVPFDLKATPGVSIGSQSSGAGAGKLVPLSVSCAVGPVSLGYSTATGAATGATGSGTTTNVLRSPAVVVVTVDAEPRADLRGGPPSKLGAGSQLQPTQPNGYYTCWAAFATGTTPVNFLPTTALPKP